MPTDQSSPPPTPSLFALRQLPANVAAEQALLGALLANAPKVYEAIGGFLRPEHFLDPAHRRIFEVCARRCDAGQVVDAVTLSSLLGADPALQQAGGTGYLGKLLAAMVGVVGAAAYARSVVECWTRRQIIDLAGRAMDRAYADGDARANDIIEEAEQALCDLASAGEVEEARAPAHAAMGLAIESAVKASRSPRGLVGVPTGLRALDDITGGLRAGQFYCLAARPSMGKTTLALAIAAGAAAAGVRTLFASLEMDREAIGAVLTAGTAGLPRDATERGVIRGRDERGRWQYTPIDDATIGRMVAAQRAMASRTLIVDECRARTMAALRAAARRMKRSGGLELVVVDYLQLMRVPELARSDNRTLEVTRLSADTKALARDLGVPVLMLSQLNRGTEGREDKRPALSDLRDSGAVEQDADVVAFLYREHYYLSRSGAPAHRPGESEEKFAARCAAWNGAEVAARGRAEVIFAKQRRGPVGAVRLRYDDTTAWFSDWTGGDDGAAV